MLRSEKEAVVLSSDEEDQRNQGIVDSVWVMRRWG
jgi:hypothetical protein